MDTPANTSSFTREDTQHRFVERIFDAGEALLVVATDAHCSDENRTALQRSAAALGWEDPPTYVLVDLPTPLSDAEFFELMEGLDPVCVVLVGTIACHIAQEAYHTTIPECGAFRLFGRNACAFADLATLLQTEQGKQRVWAAIKTLQPAK